MFSCRSRKVRLHSSLNVRAVTERACTGASWARWQSLATRPNPRSKALGGITRVADGEKKLEKNARGAAGGNRPYFSLVLRGPAVPALTISYLPYAKYGHKGCCRQYRLFASCRNRPHRLGFTRKKDAGAAYNERLPRSKAVYAEKIHQITCSCSNKCQLDTWSRMHGARSISRHGSSEKRALLGARCGQRRPERSCYPRSIGRNGRGMLPRHTICCQPICGPSTTYANSRLTLSIKRSIANGLRM